ncbi:MAG TPA: tetratricopeptide repeat protein [Deltaproteobacteria bacterium]|nr:tetratricopeptide repeat protein [Deltaproteobacteria bacterium]
MSASPWLVGPFVDMLVGSGLAYLMTLPLLLIISVRTGFVGWPVLLVTLISILVSVPHYGATLLRVYEERSQRQRYALFAYYLTGILALVFLAGIYSIPIGSALLTLYVSWSPWHIGGQNYGVALTILRRRGVEVTPLVKRLLYVSFVLSFLLALLSIHVENSNHVPASGLQAARIYRVIPVGIPSALVSVVFPVVLMIYVGSVVGAFVGLVRRGVRGWPLVSVVSLVAAQALWFVVPALLFFWSGTDAEGLLPFAAIWISAAHSAQYLWITTHYARRIDPGIRTGTYLGKALLAGAFVTIFPGLLFLPDWLGAPSWAAGLGTLLFAVVNIHHFALDGAIWKLRDGHVARALLRDDPGLAAGKAEASVGLGRWGWRVVWIGGSIALAVTVHEQFERTVTLSGITLRSLDRARDAIARLEWTGRDSDSDHLVLANSYLQAGNPDAAEKEYRESLARRPSAEAVSGLAAVRIQRRDWSGALENYDRAQRLDPDNVDLMIRRSDLLNQLESETPPVDRAAIRDLQRRSIRLLERALDLDRRRVPTIVRLARVYTRSGRRRDAAALIQAALEGLEGLASTERAMLEREKRALSDPRSGSAAGTRAGPVRPGASGARP